jgi:dihydrofolate reductase
MGNIIIIAAVAENNAIGKDNKIPWHIKEDFQHFKDLTTGHTIIMGKKTFLSLPKKPLPNRKNIVLTFEEDSFDYPNVIVRHSLKEAINEFSLNDDLYIIGGASIYKQSIEYTTKLEITKVNQNPEADTFFPEINLDKWKLINEEKKEGFSFLTYIKR